MGGWVITGPGSPGREHPHGARAHSVTVMEMEHRALRNSAPLERRAEERGPVDARGPGSGPAAPPQGRRAAEPSLHLAATFSITTLCTALSSPRIFFLLIFFRRGRGMRLKDDVFETFCQATCQISRHQCFNLFGGSACLWVNMAFIIIPPPLLSIYGCSLVKSGTPCIHQAVTQPVTL